jgi:hypothetical protein
MRQVIFAVDLQPSGKNAGISEEQAARGSIHVV